MHTVSVPKKPPCQNTWHNEHYAKHKKHILTDKNIKIVVNIGDYP